MKIILDWQVQNVSKPFQQHARKVIIAHLSAGHNNKTHNDDRQTTPEPYFGIKKNREKATTAVKKQKTSFLGNSYLF